MDISIKDGGILISNIETPKLITLLKCQVEFEIIFNNSGISYLISTRTNNGLLVNGTYTKYSDFLKDISGISGLCIYFSKENYSVKEPLIQLIADYEIKPEIVDNCVYLNYVNNMFEIVNKSFPNGDSDKLYYFEQNDTILAFSENGPVIITDNENINSITDVICN